MKGLFEGVADALLVFQAESESVDDDFEQFAGGRCVDGF
jgi:hypothetical protein